MNKNELNISDRLLALKDYTGEDSVIDSYEMKSLIDKQPTPKCYKSGLPELDTCLEGFTGGELIAVSGPRKSGKTLFCQSITGNLNQNNARCLWFSYELPAREFIKRFPKLPLFVMPKKMKIYSMDWLRDRILESIAKYGISMIFIDHLHFLFDMVHSRNTSIQIGQIIRSLKTMAIDLNITIFILCHMAKTDPYEEPTDDKIRDSSFVSQESDVGLMIWRDTKSEDQAWLKICYSRRTGVLEKKIKLVKADGLLRECTNRRDI